MTHEVNNALEVLVDGGLILYPTDTVWGIGCDANNPEAVDRIYTLKQRQESKAMICLVADDRMLKRYVRQVPTAALDIIQIAEKPISIVYDEPQNLAGNLISSDNTIAIRIPDDEFCYQLLRKFNGAIVSTSANISGTPTPNSYKEISQEILKGVDYVVNLHRDKRRLKSSSVIKLSNTGEVKILRP